MRELLQYPGVIYDANCIVYYCFQFQDADFDGRRVLVSGPHTDRARQITTVLIQNNKAISTIRKAWEEASKILAGQALQRLIDEGYIQRKLRIEGAVSPALRFRLAQALKQEIGVLKGRQWFLIDNAYSPRRERVTSLQELYREFCLDPAYHQRIPPNKGNPSETDILLVLFSGDSHKPLLTNDREISNLAPELKAHGYCELIKGFRDVRLI